MIIYHKRTAFPTVAMVFRAPLLKDSDWNVEQIMNLIDCPLLLAATLYSVAALCKLLFYNSSDARLHCGEAFMERMVTSFFNGNK